NRQRDSLRSRVHSPWMFRGRLSRDTLMFSAGGLGDWVASSRATLVSAWVSGLGGAAVGAGLMGAGFGFATGCSGTGLAGGLAGAGLATALAEGAGLTI